jgi:hypothetical protein
MIDLKEISDGWVSFIRSYRKGLPKAVLDTAEKRAEVCKTCPHLVKTDIKLINRHPLKCDICGCVFPVITYSKKKKCPLDKWEK